MLETTATKLVKNLPKEVEPCFHSHEALHVKQSDGKDFVIISAEDWRAIEETLFLNQIPGMVASIHDAANESLDKGVCLLHDLERIKQ
jgi:PHD/YefM family antitoxin component YafN of YafNO toxin-antitoxin module